MSTLQDDEPRRGAEFGSSLFDDPALFTVDAATTPSALLPDPVALPAPDADVPSQATATPPAPPRPEPPRPSRPRPPVEARPTTPPPELLEPAPTAPLGPPPTQARPLTLLEQGTRRPQQRRPGTARRSAPTSRSVANERTGRPRPSARAALVLFVVCAVVGFLMSFFAVIVGVTVIGSSSRKPRPGETKPPPNPMLVAAGVGFVVGGLIKSLLERLS